MKINKILLAALVIVLFIFIANSLSSPGRKPPIIEKKPLKKEAVVDDHAGERIAYLISPLGRAEYNNFGTVDLNGRKVNLITLSTKVLFINETEKIYSDPESLLPLRIERTMIKFWSKEYKTEEYDQKKFTVVMKTFKGKKIVKEQMIKAGAPIQNVILLLFYLRNYKDLKKGWNFMARVPDEFKAQLSLIKLELVSLEQLSLPAGKFQAYHFKTLPNKFEFWLNTVEPRVLLKIKIKSLIDFNVLMKAYRPGNHFSNPEAK